MKFSHKTARKLTRPLYFLADCLNGIAYWINTRVPVVPERTSFPSLLESYRIMRDWE